MDMFEEHKLFTKKQGSLSGFEMQPIPVGFDAPVGQNEKKYDNVLSETPMESDSCLTLTEEEEDEHEFVISYMDTSDTESTTSSEGTSGSPGVSHRKKQSATAPFHST